MRIAGGVLTAFGILAAVAMPTVGLPGAFPILLGAALVLWFGGVATAAWCVAPGRLWPGLAALGAAALGWPLILFYGFAPLWGVLAAACGVVVVLKSRSARNEIGHTPVQPNG
ncbi:MAG: hypothetical protein AB7J35_12100 [Dehalococcoidia bacterium]